MNIPLVRLGTILRVALRHGLDEFALQASYGGTSTAGAGTGAGGIGRKLLGALSGLLPAQRLQAPRGQRLRLALEELGPIFVKFGQVLSTRRDLLPTDIADELARLQDQVPPFDSALARREVERAFSQPVEALFSHFESDPVASASVAQVHFATLRDASGKHDGLEVAVKIIRPGLLPVIRRDLALMDAAAWLVERLFADGPRLKPREVVAEFARHLHDELDLMREAANASQLRRNFAHSPMLAVPEVYWDWCALNVMTMQRMHGVPVSQVDVLRSQGVDIPLLARTGVEIFFTQVFRDGFFHADMHPGNIFVSPQGQYIALDFGIMGTLSQRDKHYLARNFLAFFNRDYRRVAEVHLESGWVPPETRVEELETAIRSVCEPIFDRPLQDIRFGHVLLRLFQVSRRFNVEIQPQLVLLQKTLLNIEGLGRQLDPQLDLWQTAKPFLQRWMNEQVGWRALLRSLREEAPAWANTLPALPRLLHRALSDERIDQLALLLQETARANRRRNALLSLIGAALLLSLALQWAWFL